MAHDSLLVITSPLHTGAGAGRGAWERGPLQRSAGERSGCRLSGVWPALALGTGTASAARSLSSYAHTHPHVFTTNACVRAHARMFDRMQR